MHQALDQRRALAHQEILERRRDRRQALAAVVHQIPVQQGRKALHVEHHQVAGQQIQADGVGGEERNPEAGDHRLLDGLGAVDLHGDVEAGELPTEHLAHRIPGVGSRFALHEALAVQSRAWYLPHPGERVSRGRHDDVRVRRERQGDDVHIARRPDHYGEVGEIVGELAQQALAIVHREIERDARMGGAKGRQDPRKEVVPGADDRDVEATAGHPLELRQRLFGLLEALGDGPGTLQHLLAGGGEEALATDALEQRQADVGRELLDLRRHRRLRQVQLFGGTREVHVPGRRREHPQLPQRQVLHSPPAYPHSGILKSLWSR